MSAKSAQNNILWNTKCHRTVVLKIEMFKGNQIGEKG